jgi:hypothetical protein
LDLHEDSDALKKLDALWAQLEKEYVANAAAHVDGFTMPICVKGIKHNVSAEWVAVEGSPTPVLGNFKLSDKNLARLELAIHPKTSGSKLSSTVVPDGYVAIGELHKQRNDSKAEIKAARTDFMKRMIKEGSENLKLEPDARGEGAITITVANDLAPISYCRISNGRTHYDYFVKLGTSPEEQRQSLANLDSAVDRFMARDVFTPLPYVRTTFERWHSPAPENTSQRGR